MTRSATSQAYSTGNGGDSGESVQFALQAGQVGVWEWDVASGRLVGSPALEEIFGIEPGTFGGRMDDLLARVHEADRPAVLAAMERAVQERANFRCAQRIQRQRDSLAWVEFRGRVLPVAGDAVRVAGVCLEVTQYSTTLEELEAERERLRGLVREHSEALQELLGRLDRVARLASRGTVAAEIAHETNNSLASILMIAESAIKSGPAEAREDMEVIRDEAMRVNRIMRDMREAVRGDLSPKVPGDLNAVVKRAVMHAQRYISCERLVCSLELADSLPPVALNETAIEQVIVNLLKNAHEAATGEVRVAVATALRADAVELRVADDGPGIEAQRLEDVFVPFFSTKTGGCRGLGLSLSRRIIEEHGGRISVSSAPGRGAVFTVTLPPAPAPGSGDNGKA